MKKFTIIGGGASGTLLAVNLIKNAAGQPFEINLIEARERFGRGVAYSATADFHQPPDAKYFFVIWRLPFFLLENRAFSALRLLRRTSEIWKRFRASSRRRNEAVWRLD